MTRIRERYSESDIEEALNSCNHAEEVEPQMAGMRNEKTQFKVETDGKPHHFIEEVEEIAYEFGATFDSEVEGDTVKVSPFEQADDVEFED